MQACDKAHVAFVRKADPAALPAPKYKAGDPVTARWLMATYEGVVSRTSPMQSKGSE